MSFKIIPNKEISELVVALYSKSQNCFHIEDLHSYVKENIYISLLPECKPDYILIGVFNEELIAHDYIEEFKNKLKQIKLKIND